jgi:hypothetical protein
MEKSEKIASIAQQRSGRIAQRFCNDFAAFGAFEKIVHQSRSYCTAIREAQRFCNDFVAIVQRFCSACEASADPCI